MLKPRTLFLQQEQRFFYWNEPSHLDAYRPMCASGLLGEVRTHPYQRDLRWLNRMAAHPNDGKGAYPFPDIRWRDQPASDDQVGRDVAVALYQTLFHVMDEFRPNLVVYWLTWPYECVPIGVLEKLKEQFGFKLMTIVPDYDENHELFMTYDREVIRISDFTAILDSASRTERIKRREGPYANYTNTDAVHFTPAVPDPSLFKPSWFKRHDVTIAGSSEGARIAIQAALEAHGITVNRVGGLMPEDRFVPHEEYAQAIADSRLVVNSQTRPERVQVKHRVLQVLACATFLLEQRNPESERFLSEIDAEFWSAHEELVEKIRYWLSNAPERERRARHAREWLLARHNPVIWTQRVLDHVF